MLIHLACDKDLVPPLTGGTQRTFGLARGLARRHEVRALCVVPNRSRGVAEERVAGVTLHRLRTWETSLAWRLERLGLAPLFTAERAHRRRAARYRAALGGTPDALLCELSLAGLLAGGGARLRVYTAHNVEADRFAAARPRLLRRAHWERALRTLEAGAVAGAQLVVACTDEDADRFRAAYGARDVEVIPNGFDETAIGPPPPGARERARAALGLEPGDYVAVFVGGDWAPNHEALARLVRDTLPPLAGEGVKLLVVGGVARALAGRREPWLRVRPPAPDLGALLAAADAGLNPVTGGGGSNVKVPTYLAAGLAVITTPFGLRGYAPLRPLCVQAAPEAFADALRARPRGWAALAGAAPEALAPYAWGALGERLGGALARRLGAAPAAAAPAVAPAGGAGGARGAA